MSAATKALSVVSYFCLSIHQTAPPPAMATAATAPTAMGTRWPLDKTAMAYAEPLERKMDPTVHPGSSKYAPCPARRKRRVDAPVHLSADPPAAAGRRRG